MLREWVGVYLRGFCMGAADAVPGVSGGTIALITGIYDRLVNAVTALDPRALWATFRAETTTVSTPERVAATVREADLAFLVVLGAGVLSAVVTAANVVSYALAAYPAFTFAFFFGLIAASAVVLADDVRLAGPVDVAVALAGFLLAVVLTGLPPGALPHTPLVVFLSGMVAVSAMVLPGVSGSLLLIVLGQYHFMLDSLQTFLDALVALLGGGGLDAVVRSGVTVVAFLVGAVLGLLVVARVISRALDSHRELTLTFLVSLMVGALRKPVETVVGSVDAWTVATAAALLVAAVVGAGAVFALDRYAGGIDY